MLLIWAPPPRSWACSPWSGADVDDWVSVLRDARLEGRPEAILRGFHEPLAQHLGDARWATQVLHAMVRYHSGATALEVLAAHYGALMPDEIPALHAILRRNDIPIVTECTTFPWILLDLVDPEAALVPGPDPDLERTLIAAVVWGSNDAGLPEPLRDAAFELRWIGDEGSVDGHLNHDAAALMRLGPEDLTAISWGQFLEDYKPTNW